MSLKNNHAFEYFFENTVLVGECDSMPDHMLVCYKDTDVSAMRMAMEYMDARYGKGTAVQENLEKTNGFVGFWLAEVATPLLAKPDEKPEAERTPAAEFLSEKVKTQKILATHAKDFKELHSKLPEALFNGEFGKRTTGYFPSNN